jgi:ATP-dependent Clp protease ATP-binding subunit ClpA
MFMEYRERRQEAQMSERPVPPLAERVKQATMRRQPPGMFQRFTDQARRTVYLAQEEAWLLRHDHVGTEHFLLGLLYDGEGLAVTALESLDISREGVRGQVVDIEGQGQSSATGPLRFTPRAKEALELSLREALGLGHHHIGPEHFLLGMLHEGEGEDEGEDVAIQVLVRLGASATQVRERVLSLIEEREQAGRERLAIPAAIVDTAEQLADVRRQKEAAFGAGDLDRAAAARDQEKQLLASKARLEHQWTSWAND